MLMSEMAKPKVDPANTFFGRHCMERLREHYPNIGIRGAIKVLQTSTYADHGKLAAVLRRPGLRTNDAYMLTSDRRGVFVIDVEARKAVTYLRLDPEQLLLAIERFG